MRGMSKKDALACQVSLGLFAGLLGIASTAHGAPSLDDKGVRAGGATVNVGTATTIESHNTNNVIGWKDFSVKSGESVVFDSGAKTNNYLNIVTGNVTSQINGTMKGGKNVYIANSHGVVFGDGASVDVGNLYVTTRKLNADTIGEAVDHGTIDLNDATTAGVKGSVINGGAASSAGLAESDIVSLVDSSGSVKANTIVLEGKSVRIMNDAKIASQDVSAVADQSALEVDAGGTKTVRVHKGYVHVGYASSAPTYGSTGKYKNLTDANMYKLVEDKAGLDAIRDNTASLAGNYMLRKDIDFANTAHTSIGTNAKPFTGKFDGMFHEIKNMTVASGNATDYAGLFGNTSGAEIANVGIRDANLSTLDYGGAVVGRAGKGTHIFNVYNEVTGPAPAATKTIGSTGGHEVGGIVGRTDGGSNSGEEVSLDNAYNTAAIETGAAGLVGYIKGMSRVYAVYNAGKLNSATTSQAGYQSMEGTSFIKNAYTSQGARLGDSDASLNAYDSYATSTGKAKLLNTTKVTGTAVDDKDAKQASSYGAWDISDEGGANKTWRIFAGQSTPLLTAFMQGTVQAEYSYADFERPNHGHSGNVASDYTARIDGTLKTNNGKSMPKRTYDATYRKMTKADGTEIGGISDVTIHGYPSPAPAAPNNIELNTNHGRRNAGKEAMLYSGQHGYDVAGANLEIEKRKVVGSWNELTIEKEYDTGTDATDALKKSLTADSIRTSGLIAGDDAKVDPSSLTTVNAQFTDANAGYGKSLTVSGVIKFTGADAGNYSDINASGLTPPATGLKGNIRQKTVTIGFKPGKNFNKTYDGTSDVKDEINPKKPTGTDVLELTGVAGGENLNLNNSDITARYMKDKSSDAEENASGNAKVNRDIAYKNIKLADGTTGKAKNYRLVDAQGNVLYREGLAGEPTDMTKPENSAKPRYIGMAKTDGATFWGKGTIEKRKIDASAFTVSGGDRFYDGTDYLVVDGTTRKVQGTVDRAVGTASDTGKNVIEADEDKLKFTVSAAGNKAYYKNSVTSATTTKDVYNATTSPNGAQVLSYTLRASDTTNGETLANYELDYSSSGGTTRALNTTDDYAVTGAGIITPRDITLDLLKKTGIDKTYDGNANVTGENKVFGTNFGYATDTTDDHKLVEGDGAKIEAKTAVYKKKTGAPEAADKDVSRVGGTATGAVIENGKGVEYKIGLSDAIAAANYRLKYDTQTTHGGANDTVTMTGTGKITPKKLTLTSPGDVIRDYDGTSKVYASQLPTNYKNLGQTNGVVGTEAVRLDFGTGDPTVGTYYTDNTMATEAQDANVTTGGARISGTPQNYTVKYTFTPTLNNGNYEVDGTTPPTGEGKIRQLGLTDANFEMDFGDREKVFDGQDTANIGNDLTSLKVKKGSKTIFDFTEKPNSYEITGKYDNTHANLGRGAFGSRNLLTGKNAYNVTYKVKFQGQNLKNYDFNTLSSSTLYTWDPSEQTISRTKQVGYIRQKEVVASIVNPTVSKVYNGLRNVLDDNGEKIGPGAGINLNGLAQHSRGTYGSNRSDGEYDNKDVQPTLHDVTYRLKVEGADEHDVSYENDYYFVEQAGGASVTQLVGKGEIKARPIDVEFFPANRQYDGTTAVDKGAASGWGYRLKARDGDPQKDKELVERLLGTKSADPAHDKPAGDNLQGNSTKFDATQITGNYVDEHGTPQSDVGIYKDRVKYEGIKNALLDGNYTIENIKMGSGEIKKRTVNAGDIDLAIGTATKVYDGTTLVKKDGDESRKQEYIQHFKMKLGGTVWKDYALGTDYSLEGAAYDDPNVAANTAPQPGKIQYKFSLKGSSLLKNYDFTNLPAGYALAGDTLTRTIDHNTITKRPVYAHVKDVSKIYNALTDVRGGDGDGHILLSRELATFDNKLNGTAVDDTGLIKEHESLNATKADYDTKTAGTGKTVNYRFSVDSNAAIAGNYDIYDGKTGALLPTNAAGEYLLATTTNTIEKRAIKLQTETNVTKEFDNTYDVKPSATNAGLSIVSGKQGSDTVDLNTTYTRVYKSKKATRTAESKKDNINYNHIQLTGADAANYYLADSAGNALDADTSAGFFKTTGDGEITPFRVTRANFNLELKDLDKTYDGNAFVKDGTPESPAGWKASHIKKSEITDGSHNHLYDIEVDKVASATYRNAGNTADDKNVGQNKKVLFKLKFTKDTLNNFDFDALETADANGSQMIGGVYHAYDNTGKITPKDLRVKLDGYARKAYDGTSDVKDVEDRLSLVKEDIVSGDEVSLGSSKGYYQQGTAAGSPKVANANIAPTGANANGYDVAYTVQSDGADRNNYRFINAADGTEVNHNGGSIYAKGDIERRKLYASTKPVEKTYNADTDVRINNAPASANDLVEFHDAEGKKDAVFASGSYGTNATTAAYVANPAVPSATAADASDTANKWVKYTIKIDGQDAGGTDYANNYVVYDAVNPNTVVYNKAAGTNLGLTTTNNKIDRAPLYLTATRATKQYDGTKTVKKPETLLNITGGWQGGEGGNLNRTGTGSYTAEYQDANVNTKGVGVDVDYKNVKIVGTGTKPAKASNYYLSYNGTKLTPSSSETYALHGTGDITKRQLTGGALKVGFKTDPIRKYYDGTADVKSPAPKTYVNNIRATYKDENNHDQTIDVKNYTVERADYLAKSADAAAKDVGKGKDVKFQFALNDGNFDYSGVTGATLGADGVYRFSQNYDRDANNVGRGEIFGRRVALTLHLVQKVYDGTKDVGTKDDENDPYMRDVKNGYYTKDAKTGKLVEHNPNLDWKKVITLDGDGKIGGDENSGFAHGEKLDFNATGEYKDVNANRDPHYTGPLQPANKDVTYKMRLKDATANKNYSFQIRVVDEAGNTLKTATSQSFIDPQTGEGHMFDGLGNIWQKQLTLTKTNGWGKNYDGNANVTDAVKKGLQFDGVAQSDKDQAFFNFSDPANARANTFAGKLSGRYGDRAVEGSFLDTPGNTAVYKHVKRPQGNLNGTPEARDVELTGVKDAFASLQTPGSVANNYFYDGDNTVYGTGVIKPLTLDLKKTWLKNGADFSKTYDGDPLAKIGGDVLDPESKKDPQEKLKNKQAFHDKLKLSVDLGTGEKPIELDYTLYGDEKGDYEGYRPHYENLSSGHAHHGQSDANVKNSADPADTLNKDIVYKLKRINGDKAWANQAEGARYKDWELSENPSGADLRLSDAATDTHTDNKSGLRAVITPKKVEVQADSYSKIYDGTTSLTAPSLSAGELAKKQQELRSKLHVTDKEAAKMLKDDGIDFTVDANSSHFLNKDSRKADADVARDGEGNVLKDAKDNVLKDGKLVEYRLRKTGDAVKQGNYELPSAALPSGVQTDTVLGTGSITPRIVRTEFDPASTAAPDKIYDGTQYAVKDGNIHSRTFKLVDAVGDEGVVAADAGDVKLNQTHNVGRFASPNVKKDKNGVQAQDVTYHEGIELTNGRNKAGNYTLIKSNLKDSAKITPRPITATLKNEPIVKEYDGTREVRDLRKYIGKDANGKDAFETTTAFREGNINFVDKNLKVTGISAPAQPTWEAADEEKGMKLTNALYDNENVSKKGENRRVTYDIAMNSDNYMLVDAAGSSLMSGDRKAQITSDKGQIDRRKIKIDAAKDANKIYDGTANVLNPLGNLSFNYNGASAEQNEANGLVKGESDAVKAALGVQGVYRNDKDSDVDANAADSDAQDYKNHPVRYTFKKDEEHNPVLANYEITTAKGDNTIYGTGVIRRRTLDVLPDWQATYAGKGGMNFTGRIADGVNEGSPLTDEVKRDLQSFNSGVFTYGPTSGSADYSTPHWQEIQGWYTKNGARKIVEDREKYDKNYTLHSVPSRLFVAPRIDSVVPERTIRPDSKVYERAAFDESNAFGKSKDLNAALAYTGEGVNIGGTKPQQGTSTNASSAGIRQQGTGTNIGSSAGIGGAAGVNGKVQGATGAANEAARVAAAQPGANVKPQGAQSGAAVKPQGTTGGNAALAGGTAGQGGYYSPSAQPGANVKPQGAQSGAAVKPQGTTGGNAALAGGTAGQGGYYSPSAQPGASVKPQGAQSGVAVRPQGAASTVGSASSTVGAESVVDRGLAAAAGMSVGSSSDARTGASGSRRSTDYSSGAGSYADGSSRAADRGLANALGKGVGSAGYYSGKGYSHTNDDEEEEIKKKTKASA